MAPEYLRCGPLTARAPQRPCTLWSLDTPSAVRRIRCRDPIIGAYLSTRLEAALREHEARAREVPTSPVHGVPFGLKDDWDTVALITTGGSFRYRERAPTRDSAPTLAFRDAGAILLGKTNLSDLGLPPDSCNYLIGPTRNPCDLSRSAGGSSGGAAAAVADGMQAFDWGTDVGGGIRIPAALCGVYGMRLSSSAWPVEGTFQSAPAVVPLMCGQGPLTRTAAQMRAVLEVARPRLLRHAFRPMAVRGALLYVPDAPGEWPSFGDDLWPRLRAIFGEHVRYAELPSTSHACRVFRALWSSHFEEVITADQAFSPWEGVSAIASSLCTGGRLGDFRLHPATAEVLARLLVGRVTVFRDAENALRRAAWIRAAFERAWAAGYLVVCPTSVYPAPPLGKRSLRIMSCTVAGSIADATALSVPFGTFPDGLPRGLQLMGPPGSEETLLAFGERLAIAAHRPG